MINHSKTYFGENKTIDLIRFMEPVENRPLLNGHIIQIGKKQFRTERHFWNDNKLKIGCKRKPLFSKEDYESFKEVHCYVFIDITLEGERSPTFAKTPSYVHQAINNKTITITNTIYPTWK